MGTPGLEKIREAEKASHTEIYASKALFEKGSWLEKPVKTVLELLPLFKGSREFRGLDLGCGVGRNSIPVAKAFSDIPCRVDCVDILEMAIDKLRENAKHYGAADSIQGIVSGIDAFAIRQNHYDLIMAISALEHMDSRESMESKLAEIRDGIRPGGAACLIMNTSIREYDAETSQMLVPQFEVNIFCEELKIMLEKIFGGWKIIKQTVTFQRYDIPRENGLVKLETDVLTFAAQKQ